jgi:hypothetical protein
MSGNRVRPGAYVCAVAAVDPDLPLAEALRQEYRGLQARVEQSRERTERLRDLAEQAEAQAAGEEKLLRDMASVLGLSAQTSLDEIDGRLRGQRLRDVAVAVLRDQHQAREPIHYRAWFDLVKQQGYAVAGKDPLATFLAQVSRADEVEPIGRRSGLYLLRAA